MAGSRPWSVEVLISIVPNLPPAVNGLGDYGFLLAGDLQEKFGIPTHFLVADERWERQDLDPRFSAGMCDRNPERFACQLPQQGSVIMHYVNYGYQKRGCPVWLVAGLELWKRRNPDNRLITVFHEVYAFGPPWTSSFWLSPLQRHLAARLFRLSDHVITSMNRYRKMLSDISGGLKQANVMPVISNVGEPYTVPSITERKRIMAVFGGAGIRANAYKCKLLPKICNQLGIEEIIDIGPIREPIPDIGVPVTVMGRLSAPEVSSCLLEAIAGFVDYPVEYVPKSGVFAAYCSHGVVPIMPVDGSSATEGIIEGKHYASAQRAHSVISPDMLQDISRSALAWYSGHRLCDLSRIVAGLIRE